MRRQKQDLSNFVNSKCYARIICIPSATFFFTRPYRWWENGFWMVYLVSTLVHFIRLNLEVSCFFEVWYYLEYLKHLISTFEFFTISFLFRSFEVILNVSGFSRISCVTLSACVLFDAATLHRYFLPPRLPPRSIF